MHRAPRVVLVGDRRAEQRHDAVAEELVDRALVAVDLGQHQLEGAGHEGVDVLGIEALGDRGEAGDVHEEHRDLLALALDRALGREDLLGEVLGGVGRGRGERRRCGRLPALTGLPHLLQNREPAGKSFPHPPQVAPTRAPQPKQKFDPGGLSCWHRGHFKLEPPGTRRHGERNSGPRLTAPDHA